MKILETEIEFDFYDAEQMEKMESNIDIVKEEIGKIDSKNMKQSQFINEFCTIVEEGFNNIFDDDASRKIFKEKRNFKSCVQAFRDLVKARKYQEKEVSNEIKELQKEIEEMSEEFSVERLK